MMCHLCRRNIQVYNDDRFRRHGARDKPCMMSGKTYMEVPYRGSLVTVSASPGPLFDGDQFPKFKATYVGQVTGSGARWCMSFHHGIFVNYQLVPHGRWRIAGIPYAS